MLREINLLVRTCSECPYLREDSMGDYVCTQRANAPDDYRNWEFIEPEEDMENVIASSCPLPEFFVGDVPELDDADLLPEEEVEDIPTFNTFSAGLMEVQTLPWTWTQDLTPEERERFNQEMDRKANAKLKEQGYELPFDEFDMPEGDK